MSISDHRKAPFVWLHLEALTHLAQFPPSCDRVYLHILKRAGHEGKCWQSISNLAEEVNLSEGTTKRALVMLLKAGMLHKENRPGQSSIYSVTCPNKWKNTQVKNDLPTQVKNDLGQIEPRSDLIYPPGSNLTYPPRSNLTYKLDPIELDPNKLDPTLDRARENFDFEAKPAPENLKPIAELKPADLKPIVSRLPETPKTATPPCSAPPPPISSQAWLETYNNHAPTKWPRLSIAFMMAPQTLMAIRGYCAGFESEAIALEYFKGALAYLRVCPDSWYRDKALQPAFIFNPDKLPLAQFFRPAEAEKVNAEAIFESGLNDEEIKEARSQSFMTQFLANQVKRLEEVNEYRRRIGAPPLQSLTVGG